MQRLVGAKEIRTRQSKKGMKFCSTRTTGMVLLLRGVGCNIPLVYHEHFVNSVFLLYLFFGEELKAKATPVKACMLGEKSPKL